MEDFHQLVPDLLNQCIISFYALVFVVCVCLMKDYFFFSTNTVAQILLNYCS